MINVLTLTLECTQEDALEYATVVDHEGRTPIKFGTQAECERVKKFVERNSKRPQPLRLDVVPTGSFAHQVFALHIMKWIHDLAETCEGFKALICDAFLTVRKNLDEENKQDVKFRSVYGPLLRSVDASLD